MSVTRVRRLVHLDALRGLAALLVLVGHLRSFLFPSWQTIPHTPLLALFYAVTGLAHQAVVVFFVLSGYLVGGPALGRAWSGTWSGSRYVVHRAVRLLVVLVPALALTWAWDVVGGAANPPAYHGVYAALLVSGPLPGHPVMHGWGIALGNLVGLQTLVVPIFGSDGPLWSLANETWYYALGGLLAAAVAARCRPSVRVLAAVLVAWVFVLIFPIGLMAGAGIWLMGAGAERLRARAQPTPRWTWGLAGAVALGAGLIAALVWREAAWTDAAVGVCTAVAVPCLASAPSLGRLYGRVAAGVSEISYTLYLTHFPAAFALYAWLLPGQHGAPRAMSAVFVIGAVLLIGYAAGLWWLVERHTPAIRRWVEARLSLATPRAQRPEA